MTGVSVGGRDEGWMSSWIRVSERWVGRWINGWMDE